MAQRARAVRALAAFKEVEVQFPVPTWWFITICNSSSTVSDAHAQGM